MTLAASDFKDMERAHRVHLDASRPAIIRLDGRAFHTYTRGLERPFYVAFIDDMNATAEALCDEVDGTVFAYTQSDEISLLVMPHDISGFMFAGQVQKLVSVTAALAAATFNRRRYTLDGDSSLALFDSRVFNVPDLDAARQYFMWRQQDARKNAVSMAASTYFSHRELLNVGTSGRSELLASIGKPVDALPAEFLRGRITKREPRQRTTTFVRRDGSEHTVDYVRQQFITRAALDFATDEFLERSADAAQTQA